MKMHGLSSSPIADIFYNNVLFKASDKITKHGYVCRRTPNDLKERAQRI